MTVPYLIEVIRSSLFDDKPPPRHGQELDDGFVAESLRSFKL